MIPVTVIKVPEVGRLITNKEEAVASMMDTIDESFKTYKLNAEYGERGERTAINIYTEFHVDHPCEIGHKVTFDGFVMTVEEVVRAIVDKGYSVKVNKNIEFERCEFTIIDFPWGV